MTRFWLPGGGKQYFDAEQGSPWDTVGITGNPMPGIATVENLETERKVDVQNGPGLDGASLKFQGLGPASFDIVIRIWTEAQLAALDLILAVVPPIKSKLPPQPFAISHPKLAAAKVSAGVVFKVKWFDDDGSPQIKRVTLSCIQWIPPKKAIPGTAVFQAPSVGGSQQIQSGGGAPSAYGKANP